MLKLTLKQFWGVSALVEDIIDQYNMS